MLKHILISVVFALILLATAAFGFNSFINSELKVSETTLVDIKPGTTLTQLCQNWVTRGWLEQCFSLKLYSKLKPQITDIKSGTYQLSQGKLLNIINKLVEGQVHQFSITLIEGHTFKQALNNLKKAPHLKLNSLEEIHKNLKLLGITQANPEGWFYPDTYYYLAGDSDLSILTRAYRKMLNKLDDAWQKRQPSLPLANKYEALILASIIEKESGYGSERPLIASVFINRLNKKMRLQTDPTVIYGVGDAYQGDITRAHLRQKTPYNTYRINGLPPTPIALPSSQAIEATLNPAQSPYFVANGEGQHTFSETLKQHNIALRDYLKKIKNDS